ncbi:antifungal protein [Pyrenochaeta sp. MPI-SDFR-AT-0127]|nr:antifungal protein [Pyrenochaeta sp. MPI-SDFR-AT-0127]
MQITTAALMLFAALGVVATPIDSEPNSIDMRDEVDILIKYSGTCTRDKNECKYKNQENKDTFVKCPTLANKKCTNDGKTCTWDSVSKVVTCD